MKLKLQSIKKCSSSIQTRKLNSFLTYLIVTMYINSVTFTAIQSDAEKMMYLLGLVSQLCRETNPNKCTLNHLFSSSLLQHGQCCTL
jgi:hypothetical protein